MNLNNDNDMLLWHVSMRTCSFIILWKVLVTDLTCLVWYVYENFTFLIDISLICYILQDKKSIQLGPEDNLYLEGFALNVFGKADKQDRAGRADLYDKITFFLFVLFKARIEINWLCIGSVALALIPFISILCWGLQGELVSCSFLLNNISAYCLYISSICLAKYLLLPLLIVCIAILGVKFLICDKFLTYILWCFAGIQRKHFMLPASSLRFLINLDQFSLMCVFHALNLPFLCMPHCICIVFANPWKQFAATIQLPVTVCLMLFWVSCTAGAETEICSMESSWYKKSYERRKEAHSWSPCWWWWPLTSDEFSKW